MFIVLVPLVYLGACFLSLRAFTRQICGLIISSSFYLICSPLLPALLFALLVTHLWSKFCVLQVASVVLPDISSNFLRFFSASFHKFAISMFNIPVVLPYRDFIRFADS